MLIVPVVTTRPGVDPAFVSELTIARCVAFGTATPACAKLIENATVAEAVEGGGGRAGGAGGAGGEGGSGGEGGDRCNRLRRGEGDSAPPAHADSCMSASSAARRQRHVASAGALRAVRLRIAPVKHPGACALRRLCGEPAAAARLPAGHAAAAAQAAAGCGATSAANGGTTRSRCALAGWRGASARASAAQARAQR